MFAKDVKNLFLKKLSKTASISLQNDLQNLQKYLYLVKYLYGLEGGKPIFTSDI